MSRLISRASSILWPWEPDVYEEILASKVKRNLVHVPIGYGHSDIYIEVDDHISNCIDTYFKNSKDSQYAGLTLHEFLDKTAT